MKARAKVFGVALAIGLAAGIAAAQEHAHGHGEEQAAASHGSFQVPSSIKTEHQHIHAKLAAVISAGGQTGPAAHEVERLLGAHFGKEERFAMTPLGLLAPLAKGEKIDPADAQKAIAATDELRKDYAEMLKEHQGILAALAKLETAATAEGQKGALEFVEILRLHAQNEEQVLYPAALLVGARLKSEH